MKTRSVLVFLLGVAILAGVGAWWFLSSLDLLVKQAIERWGPEITGVAVRVESVKIEATEGRGTIRGLVVGNPKGFEAPHAVRVRELRLTLEPASLAKDVVVIRELVLASPDVVYERGQGSDNLTVIQKNVDAWVAKRAGGKQEAGPGKKFVIQHLYLRDGRASFGTTLGSPLPDLHLRDIGKASNGATAGEVVKQVWQAMLRSVTGLASRLGEAVKKGAGDAVDAVKKLFR